MRVAQLTEPKSAPTLLAQDSAGSLPLTGVKVLDLSRVLAGPWATMSLADMGAEIWKIENINGGDDTRAWSTPNYKGVSTYFLCANRGKQSIAVDLKHPAGREIVRELAKKADVLVENFRAGTMDRLGFGYEDLHALNPQLIYCSISGYGQVGPEADRPGYDFVLQAESGLMSITGEVDGDPLRAPIAITDVIAGMTATQSILAALLQARASGKGQRIDVALLDCALNLLINVASGYLNTGNTPKRFGNAHPTVVPYQVFEGSDAEFVLAVGNDRQFSSLCRDVIDQPQLAEDPRFKTAHCRAIYREDLLVHLAACFASKPCAHWLDACARAGIPAGVVKDVAGAFASRSVVERDVVQTLDHPVLGEVRLVRPAHGLAAQGANEFSAPPMLGQDTETVLKRVLGYDTAQIDKMEAQGAVARYAADRKDADEES